MTMGLRNFVVGCWRAAGVYLGLCLPGLSKMMAPYLQRAIILHSFCTPGPLNIQPGGTGGPLCRSDGCFRGAGQQRSGSSDSRIKVARGKGYNKGYYEYEASFKGFRSRWSLYILAFFQLLGGTFGQIPTLKNLTHKP